MTASETLRQVLPLFSQLFSVFDALLTAKADDEAKIKSLQEQAVAQASQIVSQSAQISDLSAESLEGEALASQFLEQVQRLSDRAASANLPSLSAEPIPEVEPVIEPLPEVQEDEPEVEPAIDVFEVEAQ